MDNLESYTVEGDNESIDLHCAGQLAGNTISFLGLNSPCPEDHDMEHLCANSRNSTSVQLGHGQARLTYNRDGQQRRYDDVAQELYASALSWGTN
jgi:hypothetical protein